MKLENVAARWSDRSSYNTDHSLHLYIMVITYGVRVFFKFYGHPPSIPLIYCIKFEFYLCLGISHAKIEKEDNLTSNERRLCNVKKRIPYDYYIYVDEKQKIKLKQKLKINK